MKDYLRMGGFVLAVRSFAHLEGVTPFGAEYWIHMLIGAIAAAAMFEANDRICARK